MVPEGGIEVGGVEDVEVSDEAAVVGGWEEIVAARVHAAVDPFETQHPSLAVTERGVESAPPLHDAVRKAEIGVPEIIVVRGLFDARGVLIRE